MTISIINKTSSLYAFFICLSVINGLVAIKYIPEYHTVDTIQYNTIAAGIADHGEYRLVDGWLLSPGYPFFLAVVYRITGFSAFAVKMIQFAFIGLIGSLIFAISKKFFRFPFFVSLALGIITIFWPYFILFGTRILTEILYSLLLALFFYFLFSFIEQPEGRGGILAGFFLGLATLTRPSSLLLPFWLALIMLIQYRRNKNLFFRLAKPAMASMAIFLLIVSPWIIYASIRLGKPVPVSSTISEIIENDYKSSRGEFSAYKTPGYEPGSVISSDKLILSKLRNVYRFWDPGADSEETRKFAGKNQLIGFLLDFYRIAFYLMLLTAAFSISRIKSDKKILTLWAVIIYVWLVHVSLHTNPRFTLPIIPVVLILPAYSILDLTTIIRRRERIVNPGIGS